MKGVLTVYFPAYYRLSTEIDIPSKPRSTVTAITLKDEKYGLTLGAEIRSDSASELSCYHKLDDGTTLSYDFKDLIKNKKNQTLGRNLNTGRLTAWTSTFKPS